jgi:hypothetical protein
VSGDAEIAVSAKQKADEAPQITYVVVVAASADKAFSLWAHYDPADERLGTPTGLSVSAYMPLPEPEGANPERLAWSLNGKAWADKYSGIPARRSSAPLETTGYVSSQLARSGVMPFNVELLDALLQGARVDLQRLDMNGHEIGKGNVSYPPEQAVAALYAAGRREALANLKSCGPPIFISPVPPRS